MKQFILILLFFIFFIANVKSQISLDSSVVWRNEFGISSYFDVSPDNKFISLSGKDGTIRIVNLLTGTIFKQIKVCDYTLFAVKYSYDGSFLIATGSDDGNYGKLTVWDTKTWVLVKEIKVNLSSGSFYAALSHDNKYLAYSLMEKGVIIRNFQTDEIYKQYPCLIGEWMERQQPNFIEFSKDDRYLAVATRFTPASLTDLQTDSIVIKDEGSSYYATFNNDGSKFVCDYFKYNNTSGVNVCDTKSRSLLRNIKTSSAVYSLSVSPNNRFIVAGVFWSLDPILIWDINDGTVIASTSLRALYAKFTSDSNYLVISNSEYISLISLKSITGIQETINDFNFSISPNPASDFIEISVGTRRAVSEQSEFKIFNVYGQTVLSVGEIHELPLRIDISGLAPGMYFVRIGDRVGKFVKL
jgi:WD40 repeat protein